MIIAVIISYIGIKFIDHFEFFLPKINKFMGMLYPFVLSFIVAYILNPIVVFLEGRFKLKRGRSILITYIGIIGILVIFTSFVLPRITSNIVELFKSMPDFSKTAQKWINQTVVKNKIFTNVDLSNGLQNDMKSYIPKLSNLFMTSFDTILTGTIALTTSFLSILFSFIISIYVLHDKEKFIEFGKKIVYILLKKKNGDRFLNFGKTLHRMIGIYIGAKALDSTIIAVMAFIGISMLHSKYKLLLSMIVGITNMIPYFGPFIGMTVVFVINLFYSPINAIWILVFLILLQQFDGWYLDPKLTGGKVGMNPFLAILSVTMGGGFLGITGMILGIPIMAVIKIYVDYFIEKQDANMRQNT